MELFKGLFSDNKKKEDSKLITTPINRVIHHVKRQNFLFGIMGHNRTGKSSTAKEIARTWKEANPHGIIMGHDPQRVFEEYVDIKIEGDLLEDELWLDMALELKNCLLILDELRMLHDSSRMSPKFRKLLSMRAYNNLDIIYIVHNPALILTQLTYFTTHYFIFYTEANLGSFEKKIPNYTLCFGASMFINKYVMKYGTGTYPNFPYMMIDNKKATLTAINIKKTQFQNL